MMDNDLVMINDIHLMLIPNGMLSKNTNSRVGIYFHMPFPSSDVFTTFPFHQDIIKSVLLCDVIGFHVFQFARNFLTICKRSYGLYYEIKFKGFITLNYLGRYIIIRIMHAGIDFDYVKSIIQKKEFTTQLESFKNIVKNKFCLVSIDSPTFSSGILLKLEAYKRFLDKYPEVRNNIIYIQVIKYDENDICDLIFEKQLQEITNEIESNYNTALQIIKVNKFTVPQRFALFTLASALYYLTIREGNCMVNMINVVC
jgi:trehalose 6-phosphate synthase/phosphatase